VPRSAYPLRRLGSPNIPDNPLYMRGRAGLLEYDADSAGRMVALLRDVEIGEEIMRLSSARMLKARDGGLLITGTEMHFRAAKSKGEARRQIASILAAP